MFDEEINYHRFKMLKPWQGGVFLLNCSLSVMQTSHPLGVSSQMWRKMSLQSEVILLWQESDVAQLLAEVCKPAQCQHLNFICLFSDVKRWTSGGSWDFIS